MRKALFWMHLIVGVTGALFIFVMALTGTILTYEKQLVAWADARKAALSPAPDLDGKGPRVDALLANLRIAAPAARPTSLVLSAAPQTPAVVFLGKDGVVLADPRSGAILGSASWMRSFLGATTRLHRWLALEGTARDAGKAIHGAANLGFLFLALSGFYLWLAYRSQLRQVIWFRRGLSGRARDFNWHLVLGFWMLAPLNVIIVSGVVISYPWAGNLVYRLAGEEPPKKADPPAAPATPLPPSPPLEPLLAQAMAKDPRWRTIAVKLPLDPAAPVTFTLDTGTGGQPQHRAQLTLDWTGREVKWEPFTALSPGRRARMFLRFAHTGEVAGLMGQTIAGLASFAAAILCLTGLALSWRRFVAWRKRVGPGIPRPAS